MSQAVRADICVIGAGSGGLTVAAGASQMGAEVVLVERGRMGGDCLNYGCVPSKALIAAANAAEAARGAARFGIRVGGGVAADFAAVHDHVHGVIAAIAPNDSVERFERLGVRVIRASARFTGPATVVAGGHAISARRFVIATGSSPVAPPIPGLADVPYFTNETIFDNRVSIEHLIVIGGGPIGMELAQAYLRLGARVTVLEMAAALARDDPELAALVKRQFAREGVALHEGVDLRRVTHGTDGIAVTLATSDGAESRIDGTHLLVAAGRVPNLDGLGLDAAGVRHGPAGVEVDARLRTSNRRVFAIGDAAAGYRFTHIAGYHAGIVIRNALFRLPAKVDYRAVPWVTYTAPELAHVGLDEAEARRRHGAIRVLRSFFADNDRAQTERETDGVLKVITTRRGVVVGAGMVGAHAGEAIQLWCLAIAKGLKVRDVAGLILPYPTLGEINKRAAGSFYAPALFGPRTRRLVRLLLRLG
jgi:pyruvate/2-oxoglutarate dehydrogenase complex dihydrolipoamide dehydrogenase (E3) component